MNQTVEFLKQTRAIIATPDSWCQCVYAIDKNGNGVKPSSDDAVKWCLAGAMKKVDQCYTTNTYLKAGIMLNHAVKGMGIVGYNDTHSHEEVIALIDKAIERSTGWRRFKFW